MSGGNINVRLRPLDDVRTMNRDDARALGEALIAAANSRRNPDAWGPYLDEMKERPPLLREGGLTGHVYLITDYTIQYGLDGEVLTEVANTKCDVTEQFDAILNARQRRKAEVQSRRRPHHFDYNNQCIYCLSSPGNPEWCPGGLPI
jgi:hypothetical protein